MAGREDFGTTVTVAYEDLSDVYSSISKSLEAHNVLKNVKLVNKLGIPVTVESISVQYVNASTPELRAIGQYYSQSPVAWFRQPAVTLVLISCSDADEFKRNFRLQLRGMVDPEIRHPLDPEPVFVYVAPGGADANNAEGNVKTTSRVMDVLRRELGLRGRERVAKVDLVPIRNSTGDSPSDGIHGIEDVVRCIQEGVAAALQTRTAAYADSTRRRLTALQESIPGASMKEYYLVKDSMAMMLESAGLMEDALREYMELEVACQESLKGPQKEAGEIFAINQSNATFSSDGENITTALFDEQTKIPCSDESWIWAPWPRLRSAPSQNLSSGALTLRQAVFANQARVLLSLERYEDLLEAGITFFHQGLLQQRQRQPSQNFASASIWAFEGILSLTTKVAKSAIFPPGAGPSVGKTDSLEHWWLGPLPATTSAANSQSPLTVANSPRRPQRFSRPKMLALMGQLYLLARSLLEQLGSKVSNFHPPAQKATISQAFDILKHKLQDGSDFVERNGDVDGLGSIQTPPPFKPSMKTKEGLSPRWRRSMNTENSPRARSLSPSRMTLVDRPSSVLSSLHENGRGSFGLYNDPSQDELLAEASGEMHQVDLTSGNELPPPIIKPTGVTESGSSSSTPTAAAVAVEDLTGDGGVGEGHHHARALPGIPVTRRATSSSSSLSFSMSSSKEQGLSTNAPEVEGRDETGEDLVKVERAIMEMFRPDHQQDSDATKQSSWRLSKAFASSAEFTSLWLALTSAATVCFDAGGRRRTATMLRVESADGLFASSGSDQESSKGKDRWNEYESLCGVALQEGWTEVAYKVLVKLAVRMASVGEFTRLVDVSTALLECLSNDESVRHSSESEWEQELTAAFGILTLVAHLSCPCQSLDPYPYPSRLLHHHRKHPYYPPAFSGVDLCSVLRISPLPGAYSLFWREAALDTQLLGERIKHCSVGDVVPVRLVVDNVLTVPVTLMDVRLELIGLQEMVQASSVVPWLQEGNREVSVDDEFATPLSHIGRQKSEARRTERKLQEWRELEDLSCPLVHIYEQLFDGMPLEEQTTCPLVQPMVGPVIIPPRRKSVLTFCAAPVVGGLYKPVCLTAAFGNMSAWVPVTIQWSQWPDGGVTSDSHESAASNLERHPDAVVLQVHPPVPRIHFSSTASNNPDAPGGYLVTGHCQWLGITITVSASDAAAVIHNPDSILKILWPSHATTETSREQPSNQASRALPQFQYVGGSIINLATMEEGGTPLHNVLISCGGGAVQGGGLIKQALQLSSDLDSPHCCVIPLATRLDEVNSKAVMEQNCGSGGTSSYCTVWMYVSVDTPSGNGSDFAEDPPEVIAIVNNASMDGSGDGAIDEYFEDDDRSSFSLREVDVPITIEYDNGCRRTYSQTLAIGIAPPFAIRVSAVEITGSEDTLSDEIIFAVQIHVTALVAEATVVGVDFVLEQAESAGIKLIDAVGMENILPLTLESRETACFSYVLRGSGRRMLRTTGRFNRLGKGDGVVPKHATLTLNYTVPLHKTPFESGPAPLVQECSLSKAYAFQAADLDTASPSASHINVQLLGPFSVIVGRPITLCWRLTRTTHVHQGGGKSNVDGGKLDPERIHYELHSHNKSWNLLGGQSGSVLLDPYPGAMATIQIMWSPLATGALPAPTMRLLGPPFDVMTSWHDITGGLATKYIYVTPDPCSTDGVHDYYTTRYDVQRSRLHP